MITPLETVLGYISPITRSERSDMDIIFYASQAFKMLDLHSDKETVFALLPIYNNQATLPDDVISIDRFKYIENLETDFPCLTDVKCKCGSSLCDNVEEDTCNSCNCPVEPMGYSSRTNNICQYTLSYNLWLDRIKYYKVDNLQYKGRSRGLVSQDCRKSCSKGWSLEGDKINIDYKEGWIMLLYSAYIKEDGKYMIADDANLLRGLALYAEALIEFDRREQQSINKYQMLLLQAETLLKRYRGSKLLKSIDLEELDALIGQNTEAQRFRKYRR